MHQLPAIPSDFPLHSLVLPYNFPDNPFLVHLRCGKKHDPYHIQTQSAYFEALAKTALKNSDTMNLVQVYAIRIFLRSFHLLLQQSLVLPLHPTE